MYEMRIDYNNTVSSNHSTSTELLALNTAQFQLEHCGATAVHIHHSSYDEPKTYVRNEAGKMVRLSRDTQTDPIAPYAVRTANSITSMIKNLQRQHAELQKHLDKARLDNHESHIEYYRVNQANIGGQITALQWALEGTGE